MWSPVGFWKIASCKKTWLNFIPKYQKPNLFSLSFFLQFVLVFWKCLWLKGLKHSKLNKLTMQYAILKRELQCFASKALQSWSWWVGKDKKSKLNVSHEKCLIFREVSIVGRMKTINSEQMRYRACFLKVNCSFTLEKSPEVTNFGSCLRIQWIFSETY